MPSLIDIRRRLRSVKNTQQITKAMKMVSAAKLRRAQERVLAARPYADLLRQMLADAVARLEAAGATDPDTPLHPLLVRRPDRRVLLLVLTGDKGLAGAFSANILKAASAFIGERQASGKQVEVIAIGRKGRDFFRRRRPLAAEYVNIFARVGYPEARAIAAGVGRRYADGECDSVYLVYNEFKSVMSQKLTIERLLPLEPLGNQAGGSASAAGGTLVDYIYEQPPAEIFAGLLPKYVEVQIFRALLESAAAEYAARMTAMDSATNNAAEMIERITLNMNRIRQASITKEIIEIVSGAAALG